MFRNRVMSKSRQDFGEYLARLNLPPDGAEPLDILSREARRATDHLEVFAMPELFDGRYQMEFPLRGMRYLPGQAHDRALSLKVGERLLPMLDVHNEVDPKAIIIRTNDHFVLGFAPRFLAAELQEVLREHPKSVTLTVAKVNVPPAPLQRRVFCTVTVCAQNFFPYSGPEFDPIREHIAPRSVAS